MADHAYNLPYDSNRHCERSEAIHAQLGKMDWFVACAPRNDGSGNSDSIVKQREHVRSHCRGAMRPSFASISTL
jgi:hypothetical protein